MKKQSKPPQFSESIGAFCRMMEDAQKDYAWNYSEVNRMDRLTQDYLHKLELDGLDYKERAKVATSLAKCRQARREYKDTVEILEPLVQFLESDKGKNLFLARFHLADDVDTVFTNGCCYWFAVILHCRFPDSTLMYDQVENHFVTQIQGRLYDITGDVTEKYQVKPWDALDDELLKKRIVRDCILF